MFSNDTKSARAAAWLLDRPEPYPDSSCCLLPKTRQRGIKSFLNGVWCVAATQKCAR